jgi:hypothetical protein
MAMKIKLMKLLQEVRGHAQITNRRPAPRQPTLYLMQLRDRASQAHAPKRRLTLKTDFQNSAYTALPIKINHIRADDTAFPMVLG